MYQPKTLEAVAEFHKTFNHPILDSPQIPAPKRSALRVNLISEELKELQEGIDNGNIVEVADALADIQYVLCGAILEFGLGNCFGALFDEVQRSNMSKACATLEEAEATVAYYKDRQATEGYIVPKDGKFQVFRKEDNKLLKSINYSPADLQSIVEANLEDADFDMEANVVGKSLADAQYNLKVLGYKVTADRIDNERYLKTANVDRFRVNVEVDNGVITKYNGNG